VRRSGDGRTITIDSLEVVYQRPSGSGPVPGVIVLHELAGLSEGILEVAERLVEEGYAVAAPDFYSGHPRPICIARTLFDALFGSRGITQTRIASIRDWLVNELGGAPVAVLGFCMGGGFALMAASRQGEYQVASVNYGPVPRSKARVTDLCPIVASYGGRDLIYGPQGRRLDRFLKELNRERGLHFDYQPYDRVGHGFITRPARPRRLPPLPPLYVGYDKVTADHAWGRILAFFDQHLRHP
jgi:carboxymethylenebutenolidase